VLRLAVLALACLLSACATDSGVPLTHHPGRPTSRQFVLHGSPLTRLVSGTTHVRPSAMTEDWMTSAGLDHLELALTVCTDATGHVVDAQVAHSSGVAAYDEQVRRTTTTWVYAADPTTPRRCGTVRIHYGAGAPAWRRPPAPSPTP
jgi:hypothetical protein